EVIGAMREIRARGVDGEGAAVPFCRRFLPGEAPARRAGRRHAPGDRPAMDRASEDERAAEKAQAAMIEIVAVEIVDIHLVGACGDEGVDLLLLEEDRDIAGDLIAVILADGALARHRIIGRADPREE